MLGIFFQAQTFYHEHSFPPLMISQRALSSLLTCTYEPENTYCKWDWLVHKSWAVTESKAENTDADKPT